MGVSKSNTNHAWRLINSSRLIFLELTRAPTCRKGPSQLEFATQLRRERRAERTGGIEDPGAIARQRRDSGKAAAAAGELWAGGPAYDTDNDSAAVFVAQYRRAGIAGASAETGTVIFGLWVDQPDLQRAGLAGGDQCCSTQSAGGAAVAAYGDTVAGNDKSIADGDGFFFRTERHRRQFCRQRLGKLEQRHIGGRKMAEQPLQIELRIALDTRDVFQERMFTWRAEQQLVFRAWQHAMGGR